jgi:conjugative transfer signal peptidase TraF
MRKETKAFCWIIASGAVFYSSIATALCLGGYVWNFTNSFPLGLWKIEKLNSSVAAGDVILICPPEPIASQAIERGYIHKSLLGSIYCASGLPLIKEVAATEGQTIEWALNRLFIDGQPILFSQAATYDEKGRELTHYKGGVVPKGFVFVHAYTGGSYDSRYFGPIPESGVLGLAKPVFVF